MIFFNVSEAREFLKKNSVVFTLRKKRREGHDLAVYGSYYKWKRIGDVNVKFVDEIRDLEHLKGYVEQSGFETVEEWMSKAHPEASFLYKVSLLESPENNPGTVFVEIRMLKDAPAITGSDMNVYGPFRKGRVYAIPKLNARVFLKHGLAVATREEAKKPTLKELFKGEVLNGYVEAAKVKPLIEEEDEMTTIECPNCGSIRSVEEWRRDAWRCRGCAEYLPYEIRSKYFKAEVFEEDERLRKAREKVERLLTETREALREARGE